jgi:ketosteroid isomerase-like protein
MRVTLATDTVQRAHAALAQGDRHATALACDPLVRWTVSDGLPFGGVYDGVHEVEAYFGELNRHFSSLLVTLTEVVSTSEVVVEQGVYRGTARESRIEFEAPFCVVWQLRDGRVYDVREYADTAVLASVLTPHYVN